jgi:hypothetical protein
MVSITFLFISEGHEAIWGTLSTVFSFFGCLVLRPLPQFLRAFSQGQMPNHTGMVPLMAPTVLICISFIIRELNTSLCIYWPCVPPPLKIPCLIHVLISPFGC